MRTAILRRCSGGVAEAGCGKERKRAARQAIWLSATLCLLALAGCADFSNNRNVFMGDSITKAWSLPGVNLGVPGNTTAQMLARFPDEVPGHQYRVFALLGGINDLRGGRTPEEILGDITAMAEAARSAQMDVILSEVLPDYHDDMRYDPKIRELNAMIVQLADSQHYQVVDYYDPMYGHPEYFVDGLHPNAEGYAVMDRELAPALESVAGN